MNADGAEPVRLANFRRGLYPAIDVFRLIRWLCLSSFKILLHQKRVAANAGRDHKSCEYQYNNSHSFYERQCLCIQHRVATTVRQRLYLVVYTSTYIYCNYHITTVQFPNSAYLQRRTRKFFLIALRTAKMYKEWNFHYPVTGSCVIRFRLPLVHDICREKHCNYEEKTRRKQNLLYIIPT